MATYISLLVITLNILFNNSLFFTSDISFEPYQMECLQLQTGNYVIDTQARFDSLLLHRNERDSCYSFIYPPVDFSKQTLVGIVKSLKGCSPPKIETIYFEQKASKVICFLTIKEYGICKINFKKNMWYLIPRQKNANDLEFKININN
jgi:hypothetical protein